MKQIRRIVTAQIFSRIPRNLLRSEWHALGIKKQACIVPVLKFSMWKIKVLAIM